MLKKLLMVAVMLPVFVVGLGGVASAAMPSTNAANQANGWAHFAVGDNQSGNVELRFVSTRRFASCFEYRVDGQAPNSPNNYNPAITDGLWQFKCVNNSETTVELDFCDSVEVRMVFGAEADERFDWTAVDVDPGNCDEPAEEPTQSVSAITGSPTAPTIPTEAPQAEKPVGGVNAGAGTVMGSLAALGASVTAIAYGVIRLRKDAA